MSVLPREIFPDYPEKCSCYEKMHIWLVRHQNNYFLNQDLDSIELEDNLRERILPHEKVTENGLSTISKKLRNTIMNVNWVLSSKEDFAKDFKDRYEKRTFKTKKEIETAAAKIWSQHSEDYNGEKATVTKSTDGTITRKKRNRYIDIEPEEVLETVKTVFRNNFQAAQDLHNSDNNGIKEYLNSKTTGLQLLESMDGYSQPTTAPGRKFHAIYSQILTTVIDELKKSFDTA